jgi:hypothetical protein
MPTDTPEPVSASRRIRDRLSPEEIESLREETQRDLLEIKATLRAREKDCPRIQRDLAQLNREAVQVINDPKEIKALDQERADLMGDLNAAVKDLEAEVRGPTLADKVKEVREAVMN